MNYSIVKEDQIRKETWQAYVDEHEGGTVFHTPYLYDIFKSTEGYYPYARFAVKDTGEIEALLTGYIQVVKKGLPAMIGRRSVMMQSPIYTEQAALEALLKSYKSEMKNMAVYSEIRNHHDTTADADLYRSFGFIYEPHLDIIIDLKANIDSVLSRFDNTRKKQINRGYKRGAVLGYAGSNDMSIVKDCYAIINSLYTDLGLPPPNWDTISSAFLNSQETTKAMCFALKAEDKIIGTRIVLCYKKRIFDWYAASKKDFYNLYPNDILPWEVFKWGIQNGYTVFDFGGAGKPGKAYGVRDYKMKFGGELVEYGRYLWYHHEILYKLARFGFYIKRRSRLR